MKKFLVLAIFIMGFSVAPIAQKLLPEEYAIEYTVTQNVNKAKVLKFGLSLKE